jgi:NAD(P)-dependent dehydrogenase (short-subunit alcohol dehydrogenase family)
MKPGAVEDVTDEEVRWLLETLVVGPMRLARLALPAMRRRGDGRIVNVSSVVAQITAALTGWYQGGKPALAAVSDALRFEVRPFGIEVIMIEPGSFRTAIWPKAQADLERRRSGSVYGTAYERALKVLQALVDHAPDPDRVAEVIGRSLTVGHPRPRYLVGIDAPLLEAADLLVPRAVKDRVLRQVLGHGKLGH